jgi:polyisoprenoid-binding protein YceI
MNRLLLAVGFAGLTGLAVAPSTALAQSAQWKIDPGHSLAQFSVRHMVVANVRGQFDGPTGTVTYDPNDPSAVRVDATLDARTINTHNADRDKDLRSPLFFDVEKFPTITFKARRAEASSAGRFKVIGDLTMHGVTKEVVSRGPLRRSRTSGASAGWAPR